MPLIDSAKTNFIIRLAKQGNEWAFGSLVKRFENDVFRFAYSFLGNAQDSQDVSQEVFMKVYFALSKYEQKEAKFTTWLFVITRNECLNYLKKQNHKTKELDDKLAEASFENEVALKNDLYLNLRSLPLAAKEAFVLVALQGFTYKEAGQVLQASPGTVKSRVHGARLKLLKKMDLGRNKEMSLSEM